VWRGDVRLVANRQEVKWGREARDEDHAGYSLRPAVASRLLIQLASADQGLHAGRAPSSLGLGEIGVALATPHQWCVVGKMRLRPTLGPWERIQVEPSKIITFHDYSWAQVFRKASPAPSALSSALTCTEYMARSALLRRRTQTNLLRGDLD
jgi:hypothetical protein